MIDSATATITTSDKSSNKEANRLLVKHPLLVRSMAPLAETLVKIGGDRGRYASLEYDHGTYFWISRVILVSCQDILASSTDFEITVHGSDGSYVGLCTIEPQSTLLNYHDIVCN